MKRNDPLSSPPRTINKSPSIPASASVPEPPTSSPHLADERKLLQELAFRNRELAASATAKFKAAEERMEKHIADKESFYKAKISALETDNSRLQHMATEAIQNFHEKKKFSETLWQKMADEIDRINVLHTQREEELDRANRSLKLEIVGLQQIIEGQNKGKTRQEAETKARIEENTERYQQVINDFTEELKEQKSETHKILALYNSALADLKAEQEKSQKLSQELSIQKTQSLESSESTQKLRRSDATAEIAQQISLARTLERSAEKEKLKLCEATRYSALANKCSILEKERSRLEEELKTSARLFREKDLGKDGEIARLQTAITNFLGEGGRRELALNQRCLEANHELAAMQTEFEAQCRVMVQQTDQLEGVKKEVEDMLSSLYVSLSEKEQKTLGTNFKSLYETQAKELEVLQEQLAVKNKELVALRENKLLSFNAPRKAVTAAIEEMLDYVNQSGKSEKEFAGAVLEIKKAVAVLRPVPDLQQAEVQRLSGENARLREELMNDSAPDTSETLRSELKKAQLELEKSKKIILANIELINSLEDQIRDSGSNTNDEGPEELVRAKVEILRLNTENEAFMSSNKQLSDYCTQTISQLEQKLAAKSRNLEAISKEYTNYLSNGSKGKEEIKQVPGKRIEEAVTQLASKKMEALATSYRRLQLVEKSALQNEELKLLREEAKKMDEVWSTQKKHWEAERVELENEVHVLREKSRLAQENYDKLSVLVKEKEQLLQGELERFHVLQQSISTRIAISEKIAESMRNWGDFEAKYDSSAAVKQEMVDLLGEMQGRLESLTESHKAEIEGLNSAYQEKISLLQEREAEAHEFSGSLQTQLELSTKQVQALKLVSEKEAEKARLLATTEAEENSRRELRSAVAEAGKLKEELALVKKHMLEKETRIAGEFTCSITTLYRLLEEKNEILAQSRSFVEQVIVSKAAETPSSGITQASLGDIAKKLLEWEARLEKGLAEQKRGLEDTKADIGKVMEEIELFVAAENSEAREEVKALELRIEEREKMHAAEMELTKAEKMGVEMKLADLGGLSAKWTGDEEFVKRIEQLHIEKIVKLQQENEELRRTNASMKEKYINETTLKIEKLSETINKIKMGEPKTATSNDSPQ